MHSQVKLFWKEVREDLIPTTIESTIWDELPTSNVDTTKLEHLFESRAKDLLTKVCICQSLSHVGSFPMIYFISLCHFHEILFLLLSLAYILRDFQGMRTLFNFNL